MIGFFANTLVLRTDLAGNPAFHELLGRVRETTLGGYTHEDLPFEKLVEELQPERDMSRNPLFQVMCVLQNQPWPAFQMDDIELAGLPVDTGTAKFDLTLFWSETEGGVSGILEYNTDLFDDTTARRLYSHFEALLAAALDDPAARIGALPLLGEAERHQLLREWSGSAENQPESQKKPARCVHLWVEEQVARTPGAPAVVDGDRTLTYAELDERANRLARGLARRGVRPEALVGICVERSLEMVVAALAVLKAVGALVALDPAYPRERLATIIDDARLAVLLTQESLLQHFPQHAGIALLVERGSDPFPDESAEAPGVEVELELDLDHPIYAIYTSGSTGQPKGILVTHRAFASLLAWQLGDPGLRPGARTVQLSTFGFCVSFQEMFSCWCSGGVLVVADEMTRRDLAGLAGFLEESGIDRLHLPFAALKHLAEAVAGEAPDRRRLPSRLRAVITAGEQLQVTPAVRALFELLPACTLSNQYGASETHVVSALTLSGDPSNWPAIPPAGRPIANVSIHLLDGELGPAPTGVAGELFAGGACPPRGYLNDPVLTAQKLVPDPYSSVPGARLYRTGDAARYLADGRIEYHGRIDTQVKIRGFRVELGEIETVLRRHPDIRDAAVLAHPGPEGSQRLVAYLVLRDEAGVVVGVRGFLRDKLPEYMVPAALMVLPALPVNANGKLDREALPVPEPARPELAQAFVAPRTAVEEVLAQIWVQLLGVERVGVNDNFFQLGGHSLLATQLASRARGALQAELPLRAVFENPTVAELAQALVSREPGRTAAIRVRDDRGELSLSFPQRRLWFLHQLDPASPAYNMPAAVRLSGRLGAITLERSLSEIVRRHEALRTTFDTVAGEPRQVIAPVAPVPLPRVDLRGLPPEAGAREARRLVREEALRPFDLARGPLLRQTLIALEPEEHAVLVTLHHVVSDGWSIGVLVRELGALYEAFLQGRPSPLPELPIQYADFAAWQRRQLEGEELASQLAWWRARLAGAPPLLELPTDRPHPAVWTSRGGRVPLLIDERLSADLEALARSRGLSLFVVLLSAVATLLHRYSGQSDLSIGTPVANRTRLETEDLIGFFANTLVLRAPLDGDPPYEELLERLRQVTAEAWAHQDVPFEMLVEELQPQRDLGGSPLFQVMLSMSSALLGPLQLPGLTATLLGREAGDGAAAKFDLTFDLAHLPGDSVGLRGSLEYSRDLFDPATARRIATHFERLLRAVVEEPSRRLSDLRLMDSAEERMLVVDPNPGLDRAGRTWAHSATVHDLFRQQAARRPGKVAAVGPQGEMTYRELDERSTALAGSIGAGALDRRIGLLADPDPQVLAGMLGILKAGCGFVPIDPRHPDERLAWILEDSACEALLTQRRHLERAEGLARGIRVLCLDEGVAGAALPAVGEPRSLAYVIYTSGSTGKPKGVQVSQESLVPILLWGCGHLGLGEHTRVLQSLSFCFDFGVFELLTTLLAGGTLYFPGEAAGDPAAFAREVVRHGANTLHTTPAFARELAASGEALGGLEIVHLGGEALSWNTVARIRAAAPRAAVYNGYGPTEATVNSAIFRL